MRQDEANQLRQTIRQEIKNDVTLQAVVGKMARVDITSDQTPDGYLVWVVPDGSGQAQSLASFSSYEEWQNYLDRYFSF